MDSFMKDFAPVLPLVTLVLGALLLLLVDLFRWKKACLGIPLLACVLAWWFSLGFRESSQTSSFWVFLFADPYTFFCNSLILGGTGLSLMLGYGQLKSQEVENIEEADVQAMMLFAATGALVMVAARNLMILFLGFELLSICVYVLSGLARGRKASAEAALKYFILGAFSSAFLLYGMALMYAATGTMDIALLGSRSVSSSLLLATGIGLVVFGFGFKVSLVPFHFWTPDVYQGAPTSMTMFMAVVVKAAAFAAFLRVMHLGFSTVSDLWVGMLWFIAVITMTYGNFVALRQNSVKRMLAYSSIAHAGYMLMGFLVLGTGAGREATLFYLLVYSIMTVSSFGVVFAVTAGSKSQYENDDIESFSGIGWTHPWRALAMVIAMLSLAGMPPLAGFVGKFYLFTAAVNSGFVGLAVIAALNSVVSLYYYLRVLVVMYFSGERSLNWQPMPLAIGPRLTLSISSVLLVYIGLFSASWYAMVTQALPR